MSTERPRSHRIAARFLMASAIATKQWGPFRFEVDRPKGFVKTWDQPDGSVKRYTYPVDYGYFVGHTGEDDEGLDAFVGDDPQGKIESFLKMMRDPSGRLVPDETKFLVGLTDSEREKVLALYNPEEVTELREYTDIYELVDALKQWKDKKATMGPHSDPLAALTDEVKGLESLASEIQTVVDTFMETVPMPHVGRIAALQIGSQTECFAKCEHAARHAQRVINKAHTYLQLHPGNATATAVVRDAGMLLKRFDTYRVKAREMLSALSQKIMPTDLKGIVTTTLNEVRAALYEPNRISVTVFPHFVPTKVGESTVEAMVFDAYLTVFPNPMDDAEGLPKYQQFVLTQSTLGDTGVYLMAIDRRNTMDPTQPVGVDVTGAAKEILGYLKGWGNLISVHSTRVAASRTPNVLTRADVPKFLAAELRRLPGVKAKAGKNSVVMIPGDLNPLVKSVEFTNLDQDIAQYKMTLMNGMSGWGWDGFRKPAPVFHEPHYPLKLGVVFEKSNPGAELQAFVKYYVVVGLEKAGKIWDGTKLVPMSMTAPAKSRAKAPVKAPPVAPRFSTPADILNFIASEFKKLPGVTVKAKEHWVVMEPGKLNPLVKNIEVVCTKTTNLKVSMALEADTPNPGRGWGWSPHSGHFTDRWWKEIPLRDPATELPKVITDILNQTKISGMIYNRENKLVPMHSPKSAPAAPVSQSVGLDDITSALKRMDLGRVGGSVRGVSLNAAEVPGDSPSWFVEPTNRQRLDHYVGSFYNPGEDDDPEGWDEDGWEDEYAGPVRAAASKWLKEKFGPGLFDLEVGEKGHLSIYLTDAGMKKFMPTGKTAATLAVAVDGVTCKWVREPKRKGRMDMGRAPDKFRGWSLVAPDGRILAMISHTHDVPTYTDPKEPPAWKILIRLIAKESDRAAHGAWRQYTLKARVPAPDGDTDEAAVKRAMDLAVSGYQKQKAVYDAQP